MGNVENADPKSATSTESGNGTTIAERTGPDPVRDVITHVLPGPQAAGGQPAGIITKLIVIGFIIGYITIGLIIFIDTWVGEQVVLKSLVRGSLVDAIPQAFVSAFYMMIGAILGCGVLDVVSFHKYVAVKRDFQRSHVWGYFVAPWLAAVLGLIVFALLQTGLLVFSGGKSSAASEQNPEAAYLGFLATGFLAGFGWYEVTQRIRRLVVRFFRDPDQKSEASASPGTTEQLSRETGLSSNTADASVQVVIPPKE